MGLAKYYEDNLEIMEERRRLWNTEKAVTVQAVVTVTVTPPQIPAEKKNPVLFTQTCKCCGKEFSIHRKTAIWYVQRDLRIPKHCRVCLEARKRPAQIG